MPSLATSPKVLVGKLEWVFSSSVNYNNDEQKANGVTVFLKAKDLAAKKVILSFKMAAPGTARAHAHPRLIFSACSNSLFIVTLHT